MNKKQVTRWGIFAVLGLVLVYVGYVAWFEARLGYVQPQGRKSWTPLIGQRLDDDKCILHYEHQALERRNEEKETKPFTGVQGQGRTGGASG